MTALLWFAIGAFVGFVVAAIVCSARGDSSPPSKNE